MSEPVIITIEMNPEEAWACAQLLKRIGFDDYHRLAEDTDEAYVMRSAGEAIRRALAEQGYAPR